MTANADIPGRKTPACNPPGSPRRGLSRVEAAVYLGISPSKFDELRKDGRVPAARLIDSRKVWDVKELNAAFEEFPLESDAASDDWTASL